MARRQGIYKTTTKAQAELFAKYLQERTIRKTNKEWRIDPVGKEEKHNPNLDRVL